MFICILNLTPFSEGSSIGVPSYDKLIDETDIIVSVIFSKEVKDGKTTAKILDVLKGAQEFRNQEVTVSSPFPEISFPMANMVKAANGAEVILAARWDEDTQSISMIYARGSFWPMGAPEDVSKNHTLDECRNRVKEHLALRANQANETTSGPDDEAAFVKYRGNQIKSVESAAAAADVFKADIKSHLISFSTLLEALQYTRTHPGNEWLGELKKLRGSHLNRTLEARYGKDSSKMIKLVDYHAQIVVIIDELINKNSVQKSEK